MADKTLSLRGSFTLWTSAVVVAGVLGLTYTVYSVSSHALTAQADEAMDRVASSSAESLDLWLGSRERDAINLSKLQSLIAACTEHKLAEAQETLNDIQRRSPFYENVFLADQNGKLFLDSIGDKSVGIDLMALPDFRPNAEHARSGEVWVGEVKKSPATGRPVTLITAPIRVGNDFVGILGTPIELSDFVDTFVKNRAIGRTGYLYLIDSAGTILAHPDATKILVSTVGKSDFGRQILAQAAGSLEYQSEGQKIVAHFRRSVKKPWTVIAVQPFAESRAAVRTIQLYLLLFGVIVLCGVVTAVWLIAGRVSRLLNSVVSDLSGSADQFLGAASQISQTSQSVAQGATQQAASIGETSSAAEEVTAVTHENKQRTAALASVMKEAGSSFQVMDGCIGRLVCWMTDFKHSSEKVSKIIKAIDEIAFQTNILALNAAVEAARAGDAGLGFAVVADEVRSLARRSAEAARDTSTLIQESIGKTAEGQTTVDECARAMATNSQLAQRVVQLTEELNEATAEQVRGIDLISQSVSRIQRTTQETAASAEESAAAGEELNAQSVSVRATVAQLRNLVHGQ